ncbi:hypothetical protein ARMGADRAFT_1077517 [Armillaria gallica]|uniref:F-box domain-containing protein n=1 Tax=Armillaria gallica TaxID=47427 RepID=A0A2H3E3U3_ARMGA|nr:hypothetical protein ARMGADRAFT_1077517 [Armillaria gallica]
MAPLSPLPPPSMEQRTVCVASGGKGYFLQHETQSEIAADISAAIYCNEDRMLRLLSEHAEPEKITEELRGRLANVTQPTPDTVLPIEVLSEIFGLAIGGDFFNASDIKTGPWAFSYVCSSWRFAVCGDPTLWTSILIDDNSVYVPTYSTSQCPTLLSNAKPQKDPASLLSTVLSRSNQRDLNMVFNISNNRIDIQTKSTVIALLQKAMEHSERWKDFSIFIPSQLVHMLNAVEGNVPRLKKLHVAVSDASAVLMPSITAFKGAPALKEVSFEGIGADKFKGLPWSQVTSLTDVRESAGSYKTYTGILSSAPHLHTLIFKYRSEIDLSPDFEEDIVHTGLKPLTVSSEVFMAQVELPQLINLTVTPPSLDYDTNDHINALITSSGDSLQFLHIDFAFIDNIFFEILNSTPGLVHLKLNYPQWCYEDTEDFDNLALHMADCSDSGEHKILPALQALEITIQKDEGYTVTSEDEDRTDTTPFGFMDSDLVMVVSRWNAGALKLFRFEADTTRILEDISLEDVAGLRNVKEEGLGISVVTTSEGISYTTGHWDLRFDQEDHRRVYV